MQTKEGSYTNKYNQFILTLLPLSSKVLKLKVIDTLGFASYAEQRLQLNNITPITIIKGLQNTNHQIKIDIQVQTTHGTSLLKIYVEVQSQYLRNVEQTIYLQKTSDIKEAEIIQMEIQRISKGLKDLGPHVSSVLCNGDFIKTQSYASNDYEPIAKITLPRGKYVLTLSALIKGTSSGLYLYQDHGKQVMKGGGFYIPAFTHFLPFIISKNYEVQRQEETVNFTTWYAAACNLTVSNAIVSAQRI